MTSGVGEMSSGRRSGAPTGSIQSKDPGLKCPVLGYSWKGLYHAITGRTENSAPRKAGSVPFSWATSH